MKKKTTKYFNNEQALMRITAERDPLPDVLHPDGWKPYVDPEDFDTKAVPIELEEAKRMAAKKGVELEG
jgi:hypothetical protein